MGIQFVKDVLLPHFFPEALNFGSFPPRFRRLAQCATASCLSCLVHVSSGLVVEASIQPVKAITESYAKLFIGIALQGPKRTDERAVGPRLE